MHLKINLEPVPKLRARHRVFNNRVLAYTPTATAKAEKAIREAIASQDLVPFEPLEPLKLTVTFYRCKSKWLKTRETMPVRKPDLDNFLKLLMDALNGVAFADDAQITTFLVKKRWTPYSRKLGRGKVRPARAKGYIMVSIEEDKL